jgi:hypothetical protein
VLRGEPRCQLARRREHQLAIAVGVLLVLLVNQQMFHRVPMRSLVNRGKPAVQLPDQQPSQQVHSGPLPLNHLHNHNHNHRPRHLLQQLAFAAPQSLKMPHNLGHPVVLVPNEPRKHNHK